MKSAAGSNKKYITLYPFIVTHTLSSLELYRTKIKPNREGWVYLIHAEGTQRYKIGRSINLPVRRQTLQKQSPYELTIDFSFYTVDAITDEAKLHELLAPYRVHGEWFDEPIDDRGLMVGNFFSYTNEQLQNDARIILSKLGVDFEDRMIEDALYYFCSATLEQGKNIFFWSFLQEEISLWVSLEEPKDVTTYVAGLLRGAAIALYQSRVGEI